MSGEKAVHYKFIIDNVCTYIIDASIAMHPIITQANVLTIHPSLSKGFHEYGSIDLCITHIPNMFIYWHTIFYYYRNGIQN